MINKDLAFHNQGDRLLLLPAEFWIGLYGFDIPTNKNW